MLKKILLILSLIILCFIVQSCDFTSHTTTQTPALSSFQTSTLPEQPTNSVTPCVPDDSVDFDKNNYLGILIPPFPCGMKSGIGFIVDPFSTLDWGVDLVSSESQNMLWLEKKVNEDQWEIFDILVLPPFEENWRVVPSLCSQNGEEDPKIIVIAFIDQETKNTRVIKNKNIIQSWRIDFSSGKIEEIDNQGVECYADEAFGP